jgi:hypothetical protein
MPKISIENSPQEWAAYDDIIDRVLMDMGAISQVPALLKSAKPA